MISVNEFLSLCTESYKKEKFGIEYVEKIYQKPSGEKFTFVFLTECQFSWINSIILDLVIKCYSFYKNGNRIKISFCGYKLGIISFLIKLQNNDLVMYRSVNFLLEEKQMLYPSLFLYRFQINKKTVKKIIRNSKSLACPILETLHISGNNIKVFCKRHKNNDLFLINIKMLD